MSKTLVYKGETWEFTKPTRPSTAVEERMMIRHRHRTDCPGRTMAQLRNAGILFDKYVCETCMTAIG